MRRLALLALVLGAAALAQFPQHRLFEQPNLQRFVTAVASAASWGGGFFSFAAADAGYRGLTSACACQTVYGVTEDGDAGVALQWVYSATGTCSKRGAGLMGYVVGDLVECPSSTVRVEPDDAGGPSVSTQQARTMPVLRTEEFENAAWVGTGTTYAKAVWANDAGDLRDGGMTVDAVFFNSTQNNEAARLYQTVMAANTYYVCSVFAQGARPMDGGAPQDGVIDMVVDGTSAGFLCGTCSYVAATATRCVLASKLIGSTPGTFYVGNDSRAATCGNGVRASRDVLLWGANCMPSGLGGTATGYVSAVAAAVAVPATADAGFPLTYSGPALSVALSATPFVVLDGGTYFEAGTNTANFLRATSFGSVVNCELSINGALTRLAADGGLVVGASNRIGCAFDGTTLSACLGGICTTGIDAGTLWSGAGFLHLGMRPVTGFEAMARLNNLVVCQDGGCR